MSKPSSDGTGDGVTSRSDAASRLAALLSDVVADDLPEGGDDADSAPDGPPRRIVRRSGASVDQPGGDASSVSKPPVRVSEPEAATPPTSSPAPTEPIVEDDGEPTAAIPTVAVGDVLPAEPGEITATPTAPRAERSEPADSVEANDAPWAGIAFWGEDEVPAPVAEPAPSLEPPSSGAPEPAAEPAPPVEPRPSGAPAPAWAVRAQAAGAGAPGVAAPRGKPTPESGPRPQPPPADDRKAPRFTFRVIAFSVAFLLLVAAVPALAIVGKDRILRSRGGEVTDGRTEVTDPGYTEAVDPTPTTLVVHRDADGVPTSATILALGAGDEGGTVLLVPLSLQPLDTTYFSTILGGYLTTEDDDGFRRSIEDVLGVSLPPPLVDLTDESLATLVSPVAPLSIDVTDPVLLDNGRELSGSVSLAAEDIGPFLRATKEGELEISRLERAKDLWTAWLDAIKASPAAEPIGAAVTGIGGYLRVLSAGTTAVETLEVQEAPITAYQAVRPLEPAPGMDEQVIDAIPSPRAPRTYRRFNMDLRNGAEGGRLPDGLMRELVLAGGALYFVGNADTFGQVGSTVLYKTVESKEGAEVVAEVLGGDVKVEQMSARVAESENEDLVITVGSDALERFEARQGQEDEDGG